MPMAYQVLPMNLPAGLTPAMNGKLFPSQLAPILLPGVGMGTLHPLAKQAFECMFMVAQQETSQTLTAVSNADDYRSYDMQLAVFLQRYTKDYLPLRNVLTDRRYGPDGNLWYKRSGVAAVASPGTSNHGYGLALDTAIWMPEERKIVSITSNKWLFGWLGAKDWFPPGHPWRIGTGSNAESFGIAWESQSEPWHLRYNSGNVVPQRIVDIKSFLQEPLVS